MASRAPASTARSSIDRSSRSPIRCRRQRRMHGERDDVRLVDHQPHAAVRGDVVPGANDEVLGQPVGLELAPVGVRWPGRLEARPLDRVDRRQVGRPASARSGASAAVVRPCHLPRLAGHPAWQRDVLRDELREVVGGTRREAAPRRSGSAPGPGPARARSPRSSAVGGRPAVEVDRDELLPGRQVRFRPARAGARAGRPGGPGSGPTDPAGSSRTGDPASPGSDAPRPAAPRPSTRRRSGDPARGPGPSPWRSRRAAR